MKKHIRAFVSLLCAAALALGCASCGGAAQSTGKSGGTAGVTHITVWTYYNGDQLESFNKLVDQFNETTGREKGIRVKSASQGSMSDLETNVMDAAQGKVGAAAMPNIFSAYADTAYALDQMGMLVDLSQYGLPKEPMPQEMIAAGVSLVSFSGDKLLGGPQAGIIVGKRELIAKLQQHPLKRALRADKMTLAALEATLRLYLHPEKLADRLPTLRLLTRDAASIRAQAELLLPRIAPHYPDFDVRIEPCQSQIGSGSLPVDRLPSEALTFTPRDGRGSHLEALSLRWRAMPVPVIGRIYDGRMWLDLRCLEDEERFLEMLLK